MFFSLSGNVSVETEQPERYKQKTEMPEFRPEKIDIRLWEYMKSADEDELISIDICLPDISEEVILERLKNEKGIDHEIYRNDARFETEIKSRVEAVLVEYLGYERAHGVAKAEEGSAPLSEKEKTGLKIAFETKLGDLSLDCETLIENITSDASYSPIEYAVMQLRQAFQSEKNKIVRDEYARLNGEYIEKYVSPRGSIITYVAAYIPSIMLEATKADILYYAQQEETINIFYIMPDEAVPATDCIS